MRRLLKIHPFLTAGVVAATGALGVSAAIGLGGQTEPAPLPTETTSSTPASETTEPVPAGTERVNGRILAAYSVFRRGGQSTDRPPGAEAIAQHARGGENPSLARRATRTEAGAHWYYLVPGSDTLCVDAENGSGACSTVAQALEGALAASVCAPDLASGSVRLFGMMPDSVEHVDLVRPDGSAITVPVHDNALTVDVDVTSAPTVPTDARWTTVDGTQSQRLPIPPDAASVNCG
jgi:hypothetical protein